MVNDTVLATIYTMDPRGYVSGANAVQGSTKSLVSHFGTAKRELVDLTRQITMFGAGAVAVAGGIAVLGYQAMKQAASFDTLQRTFAGALGSMDKGKAMMAALESYATRSAFSLEALARAATQLAAGGLDVKTFLPVLERFALVISGVDPSGLEQVAGALIRAKGGGFGEAMESLRRAGIGSKDFAGTGATFSKGGEYQGSPEQFLQAILRISQGKLKSMADSISGGDETTLSNAGDVLGQAIRQAGAVLNKEFLPMVLRGTEHLKKLIDSGAIRATAENFINLATALTGSGSIEESIDKVAFGLYLLPDLLTKFGASMSDVIAILSGEAVRKPLRDLWDRINGRKPKDDGEGSFLYDFWIKDTARTWEMMKELQEKRAKKAKEALAFPKTGDTGKEEPPSLKQIVDNTAQIAKNTKPEELRRMILGGGNLAAQGIALADLAGMRRKHSKSLAGMLDIILDGHASEVRDLLRRNGRVR